MKPINRRLDDLNGGHPQIRAVARSHLVSEEEQSRSHHILHKVILPPCPLMMLSHLAAVPPPQPLHLHLNLTSHHLIPLPPPQIKNAWCYRGRNLFGVPGSESILRRCESRRRCRPGTDSCLFNYPFIINPYIFNGQVNLNNSGARVKLLPGYSRLIFR